MSTPHFTGLKELVPVGGLINCDALFEECAINPWGNLPVWIAFWKGQQEFIKGLPAEHFERGNGAQASQERFKCLPPTVRSEKLVLRIQSMARIHTAQYPHAVAA
jgi:hypothetical protein